MRVMEWRISGLCSYREIPGGGCDKKIKERIPHGTAGLSHSELLEQVQLERILFRRYLMKIT
jgi:hypothetical protein